MAKIDSIAVIGCGTMGNGIAHLLARSGLEVVLYDLEQQLLDNALSTISTCFETLMLSPSRDGAQTL